VQNISRGLSIPESAVRRGYWGRGGKGAVQSIVVANAPILLI
jgi:hypothetical protein